MVVAKHLNIAVVALSIALTSRALALDFRPSANVPPSIRNVQATVLIDTGAHSVPYSPMIFGGFLEHFDHQIYGGVFDPGSPLSDKQGFRRDVIAALKELKCPVVRWPGGCYASGYHWEAGVGKIRRPTMTLRP